MKKYITLTTSFFLLSIIMNIISPSFGGVGEASAQNIGMNGTGANPHASALLDVDATGGPATGLLIPRIALTAINVAAPVTSPATSLLVYNTATASTGTTAVSPGYYYWDATKWVRFAYNASGSSSTAWDLLGNAGTTAGTNFLGTTDAKDLVFKTNNLEAVRITTVGNVGIGTATPAYPLTLVNTTPTITSNAYLFNDPVFTANSTASIYGTYNQTRLRSAFNVGNIYACLNRVNLTAAQTGSINYVVGSDNSVSSQALGTIDFAAGSRSIVYQNSTAPINVINGIFTSVVNQSGGPILSAIGLKIGYIQGTTNNKWSIYAADTAAPSYFAGQVGIGRGPTQMLDVLSRDRNIEVAVRSSNTPSLTSNSSATSNYHGTYSDVRLTSNFNFLNPSLYGAVNRVEVDTLQTGLVTSQLIGAYNLVVNEYQVNLGSAFGSHNRVYNYSTGNITQANGLYTDINNLSTGNITTGYGLRIGNIQATNKWSIYAADATAPNYFAGDVGIGVATPSVPLQIGSAMHFGRGGLTGNAAVGSDIAFAGAGVISTQAQFEINIDSDNNSTTDYFSINKDADFSAPTELFRVQDNGRVGIGTATPGGLLELGLDQGRKPGTNTWTIVSDERLKKINGNYTKGLFELMQLNPITYHYKNVGERTFKDEVLKTEQVGFSAQEVQKVFPEAVGTDSDGYLNLNTHAILVAYLNAIKELSEQNKIQTQKIEVLEKEIELLKKK